MQESQRRTKVQLFVDSSILINQSKQQLHGNEGPLAVLAAIGESPDVNNALDVLDVNAASLSQAEEQIGAREQSAREITRQQCLNIQDGFTQWLYWCYRKFDAPVEPSDEVVVVDGKRLHKSLKIGDHVLNVCSLVFNICAVTYVASRLAIELKRAPRRTLRLSMAL